MDWLTFLAPAMCRGKYYVEEEYQPEPPCVALRVNAWRFLDEPYEATDGLYDRKSLFDEKDAPMEGTPFTSLVPYHQANISLGTWLKEGAPTLSQRFSVLNDLVKVFQEYHSKDVVHGNLTQKSVCIARGQAILTERPFGPTPGDGRSWTDLHTVDEVHGARWTAPEFFALTNNGGDDFRPTKMSDVYSFGCIMLQVLTGKVPHCGTKRSEQVVYLKYLGREPIDDQTPEVADRYVAFMRRCWSPVPENRPTISVVGDFIREEMKRFGHSL